MQQLNEHLYRRLTENSGKLALTNGHGRSHEHKPLTSGAMNQENGLPNGHAVTTKAAHGFLNGNSMTNGDPKIAGPLFTRLQFENVPTLFTEAHLVQRNFLEMTTPLACEIGTYAFPSLSAAVFRGHGYAPRAACQVAIQLAALIYFGEKVPCWETVSLRGFHRGRVDIIQTVTPSMYNFCSAALQDPDFDFDQRGELRRLFAAATQAHTINVTRASRGLGFAGHFYALQEVLHEDEGLPDIFTDPTYQRTRPAKLMTDCTDWTAGFMLDGGWVMPHPDHVWVHYEVMNEEAKLFVKAPAGRLKDFSQSLQRAASIIQTLLDTGAQTP